MAHVAFDTLKFVEKLTLSGIPEKQAKALVEAQNDAFTEALDLNLVTKTDLLEAESKLEHKLLDIKSEIKLLKWMMGFLLAGVGSLIIKAFF